MVGLTNLTGLILFLVIYETGYLHRRGLRYQLGDFSASILAVVIIESEDLVALVPGEIPDGGQIAVGELQGLRDCGVSKAVGPGLYPGPGRHG